jgi:hypothetical protein
VYLADVANSTADIDSLFKAINLLIDIPFAPS